MPTLIALTLTAPLFALYQALPFHDMLVETQMVVIARVDSIWTYMDTISSVDINGKPFQYLEEQIHVTAKILSLYAKTDSLRFPAGSVHIGYHTGTKYYPDGSVEETGSARFFNTDEAFLAPLVENTWLSAATERIYFIDRTPAWKYSISDDSLYCGGAHLSLAEARDSLSAHFIKIY